MHPPPAAPCGACWRTMRRSGDPGTARRRTRRRPRGHVLALGLLALVHQVAYPLAALGAQLGVALRTQLFLACLTALLAECGIAFGAELFLAGLATLLAHLRVALGAELFL